MLKGGGGGGHNKFWGSFNTGALSFSHTEEGEGGWECNKFWGSFNTGALRFSHTKEGAQESLGRGVRAQKKSGP